MGDAANLMPETKVVVVGLPVTDTDVEIGKKPQSLKRAVSFDINLNIILRDA